MLTNLRKLIIIVGTKGENAMDINVKELREKADTSKKVLDKLNYIYYILIPTYDKFNCSNSILDDIKSELEKLVNEPELTRFMNKRNFDYYINCKNSVILIQQKVKEYENSIGIQTSAINPTEIIESYLKEIIRIITVNERIIKNNKT